MTGGNGAMKRANAGDLSLICSISHPDAIRISNFYFSTGRDKFPFSHKAPEND